MWLPKGALAKSIGRTGGDFPDFEAVSRSATRTSLACPACPPGTSISRLRYASDLDLEVETCPNCGGIFLDFQEFATAQNALRRSTPASARTAETGRRGRAVWDRAWELYRRDFRQDRRWMFTRELWMNLPFRILRIASPFVKPPSYQSVLFNFLIYGASGVLSLTAATILLAVFAADRGYTLRTVPASLFPMTILSAGIGGAVGVKIVDFFRRPADWESYLASAENERRGRGR